MLTQLKTRLRRPRASAAWQPIVSVLPGLGIVAVATSLSYAVSALLLGVSPATVAIVLGVLSVNLGLHRPAMHAGTAFAARQLLRGSIVLLGLQLALPELLELGGPGLAVVLGTVAVTFVGTQLLGRALGLSPPRSLLVATGFSICGASAVAAMKEVSGGDDDDAAVAIALVTVCGSLAILLLPLLQDPLGLGDAAAFGSWVGASVHDVGQTVATATRVEGALTSAVVVKLARVVLLAPLVAGAALALSRRRGQTGQGSRPALVPLFVVGFLTATFVTSIGLVPQPALDAAHAVQRLLLVAALYGLGTGIRVSVLRRTGGPALVLGMLSWLLVAAVSWVGVTWVMA